MFRKASTLLISLALSTFAQADLLLKSGERLSDPTKPQQVRQSLPAKLKPAPQLKLGYILSVDGRRQALINGKKVFEGDYVDGALVTSISGNSVDVRVNGNKVVLALRRVKGIKRK